MRDRVFADRSSFMPGQSRFISGLIILLTALFFCTPALTQNPNERALEYFKLLIDRPEGAYIYDRFYDAWLNTGTLEELEGFLKQKIEDYPGKGRLLLAFFYERQNRDSNALEMYQQIIKDDPNNPQVLLFKAKAHVRLLDYESAIEVYSYR
jgi:tetratricopeptide (TPR) repeat protein